GTMRNPDISGVEELRRSRHFCVPRMEQLIRGVREGYGPVVSHRPDVGQDRRERELLSAELPLGYAKATGEQHEKDAFYRREAFERVGGGDRDRSNHASIPTGSRVPQRASLRQAAYRAKVFDLVNCGPRHRFVALGSDGPVIVHNCENVTQAVSCDLLCDALLRLEANGFETVLTVHDEAITEAPDTPEYSLERMASLMTELPDWAKGLPLAAAGFEAYRYRKD
ncbi:MAG: hypothetical protein SOV61_00960, partial [Lachnospiraceae bacterium]|nr:hypothetical protein [Lachnospiraceae bacterium]